MWHAGKAEAIICTGSVKTRAIDPSGAAAAFDADDPAEIGREILVALGVPQDRIFRSGGENTAAEMRHLVVFFQTVDRNVPLYPDSLAVDLTADDRAQDPGQVSGQHEDPVLGLITSAFHLPRAMRLAESEGLRFAPLPAGTRSMNRNDRGVGILVPTVGAGELVAIVAKEWLARLLGR
jgi:hypothetical protein